MGVNGTKCMSVEDMRMELDVFCNSQQSCVGCMFEGDGSGCGITANADNIKSAYDQLYPPTPLVHNEEPPITHDIVNHPEHYCREGGMECIDEMLTLFGREVVKHFCLCNAWKYRYRSNAKNGEEDIKKSDWYIRKYKELSE